jgi:PAT family beta-lactamase induction signal transducer AmpG
LIETLKLCLKKNLFIFFPMGFFSGLPLLLTSATLGTWLADVGVNKTTIGLFALVGIPYSLKFLWASFLDTNIKLRLLKKMGRRRIWILIFQILICVNIFIMAHIDPVINTMQMAIFAITLAFFSASQDIAIDAWRIEINEEKELGLGAALYVTGYRIALLAAGAGALVIADIYSWKLSFILLSCIYPLGIILVLSIKIEDKSSNVKVIEKSIKNIIEERVLKPFYDFIIKKNWILILVFIACFKWGDALLGVLSQPFMLEIGFSKSEIAAISKVYGLAATLIGLFVGGYFISKYGIILALWITAFLQLFSNLVFILLALKGNDLYILMLTISIENLSGGMGTAAFIAYLSSLCNVQFSAFQYALLSSFMSFSRTWLASPAGWIIDNLNWNEYFNFFGIYLIKNSSWIGFFIVTAFFSIPAIILLHFIQDKKG